jgi:methionyl-tRNA formyltransferase
MALTKCVFMGSDPIAIPMLDILVSEFRNSVTLDAVFTQPDRRTGRGKSLHANEIKSWATERKIPVYQPEKIGATEVKLFRTNSWQLGIVMAYGHILNKTLLSIPELGFYNLHASILPKLRGASPIETAIVTGETETGVTLIKIIQALDAGPIAGIERRILSPEINSVELRTLLAQACIPLLRNTLPSLLRDAPILQEQDSTQATYCRLIDKQDGWVDFALTAKEVTDHVRGFYPWPGASFNYSGTAINIGSAEEVECPEPLRFSQPGTLFCDRQQLIIACGDNAVRIHSLQKPGGKMIATPSFLNGFEFISGSVIDFPRREALVSDKYFRKSL